MPKPIYYKANAFIYFQGDMASSIPILKQGKVEITYQEQDTGIECREAVKTGAFFGVKAALAGQPHHETAMALTDCTLLLFSLSEFDKFIADNPRILLKMLQVFSTQLRHIHKQTQGLLSTERINVSQEAGLFAVAEYYLKEKRFAHAAYSFARYLHYWPKGAYAPQATLKAREAEQALSTAGTTDSVHDEEWGNISNYSTLTFSELETQYKMKNYKNAIKGFLAMVSSNKEPENMHMAGFRIGACLYHMQRYGDAIKQLSSVLRKYPKHSELGEILWFMGISYDDLGNTDKAMDFYRKAGQLVPQDGNLYRQITEKLRS